MPTLPERLEATVDQVENDGNKLHAIVHGASNAPDVSTEGGNVKPIAKVVAQAQAAIDNIISAIEVMDLAKVTVESAPFSYPFTRMDSLPAPFTFARTGATATRRALKTNGSIVINSSTLNGGFETAGGGGADAFASWTENVSGTSTVNRDTTDFRTGVASCRIDVDGSNSFCGISAGGLLVIGRRYRLRFWAKASSAAAALRLNADTAGANVNYNLTTAWALYDTTFVAHIAALNIVRDAATGLSIWIDDVVCELLPSVEIEAVAADTPRFDFNPVTRDALGLLLEEARTNLLLHSHDPSNAAWTKSHITPETPANWSPRGTNTRVQLTETTGSGEHYIYQNGITLTSGLTYTAWALVRAGTRTRVKLRLFDQVAVAERAGAVFNLSAGTVQATTSGTAFIENWGDGWYLCSVTGVPTATNAHGTVLNITEDNGVQTYVGNTANHIFFAASQMELGGWRSSYVPTTTASVTRNVDNCTVAAAAFARYHNPAAGTWLVDWETLTPDLGYPMPFSLYKDADNFMYVYRSPGNVSITVRAGGVTYYSVNRASTYTFGKRDITALGYAVGDIDSVTNGAAIQAGSATELIPTAPLYLGRVNDGGSNRLSGRIRRLTYLPYKVSNTLLSALTQIP